MRSAAAQIDRVLILSIVSDRAVACRYGRASWRRAERPASRLYLHEQGLDTETSNGMSMFDLAANDGAACAPEPAGSNSARTGSGPEFVDPIRTPSNSGSQDREGQALPGDGQGSSRGGEVGRWD